MEEGGLFALTRRILKSLCSAATPGFLCSYLYLVFRDKAIAWPSRGNWTILRYDLETWRDPSLSERVEGMLHGSPEHIQVMEQIYSYQGFLELEQNDTVFDIGAYAGGFTRFAAGKADLVVAVDPNASIDDSLQYNTAHLENVRVVAKAAWKENGSVEINKSSHFADNTILTPDNRGLDESFTVEAETVGQIAENQGIQEIDFLKIEAEGAEPEILEAALTSRLNIHKIAVDATEERDGKDTVEQVTELLEEHGYTWKRKNGSDYWGDKIIFGKKS